MQGRIDVIHLLLTSDETDCVRRELDTERGKSPPSLVHLAVANDFLECALWWELKQSGFCVASSHDLNLGWLFGNWTNRNKIQQSFNQNRIFIPRKCIWKCHLQIGGFFSGPQYVNKINHWGLSFGTNRFYVFCHWLRCCWLGKPPFVIQSIKILLHLGCRWWLLTLVWVSARLNAAYMYLYTRPQWVQMTLPAADY